MTPIFKKGVESLVANHHPISLTCIICKVLEHIVASNITVNITKHLDKQGLMYDLFHGFRRKRSCETQLAVLIEACGVREGVETLRCVCVCGGG